MNAGARVSATCKLLYLGVPKRLNNVYVTQQVVGVNVSGRHDCRTNAASGNLVAFISSTRRAPVTGYCCQGH